MSDHHDKNEKCNHSGAGHDCGCGGCGECRECRHESEGERWLPLRLALAATTVALLLLAPMPSPARVAAAVVGMLLAGAEVFERAVRGLRRPRGAFDENFLMTVASLGAAALGEWPEAVAVLLFYRIGERLEDEAGERSRRNVARLLDLRPEYARVVRGDVLEEIPPDGVRVGDILEVRPGERVPVDGVATAGHSTMDAAALTGESLPFAVAPGDSVKSGCVNLTGTMRMRATRQYSESTAARILALVESAAERRARPEAFIRRFARVYTPSVCALALALAVGVPLARLALGTEPAWGDWTRRALVALLVSCPCALVVSVPLSFFGGIGGAGSQGILVKGSNVMEALARVRAVAFDKTGTLTRGVFEVSDVLPVAGRDAAAVLDLAAHAEADSPHPLARGILRAFGRAPDRKRLGGSEEVAGRGVRAIVDGRQVAVGGGRFVSDETGSAECLGAGGAQGGAEVHVATGGGCVGHIELSDAPRSESAEAVSALRRAGVTLVEILTGDREPAARRVADALGVEEVRAGLMPDGKVAAIEELMARTNGHGTVAFVGDGLNDAPVLARADVGIAMGGLGSDAAIEAADAVIMDDDPRKVAKAIRLARRCMAIVRQNIVFAIGAKCAVLALGAANMAGMWAGIFADVGVMLLCVLNAARCLDARRV